MHQTDLTLPIFRGRWDWKQNVPGGRGGHRPVALMFAWLGPSVHSGDSHTLGGAPVRSETDTITLTWLFKEIFSEALNWNFATWD